MDKREFNKLLASAKRGDAEAMYLVGLEYESGDSVEADGDKALEWINDAADCGNKDAIAWLKQYYFDDDASTQSYS